MILVIYPEADKSTQSFINYLSKKNIDHVALKIDQDILCSNISIIDNVNDEKCLWKWSKNKKLDFNLVDGIYNRVHFLDHASFFDYHKDDVEYAQKEWWAYLTYFMGKINYCINPPSYYLTSGIILDFTYFLRLAKEIGFNVPEYHISTSYLDLKAKFNDGKNYIALNSLFFNNKFLPSKEVTNLTVGLIEYIKGNLILVHIVEQNFYCCLIKKDKKQIIKLDTFEERLLLRLKDSLELRVMQVFLIQSDKKTYLLNLSAFPNWDYNTSDNIDKIFRNLVSNLLGYKN